MIKSFYKKMMASVALFTLELVFVWLLFIACVVVFFYISSQIMQGDELGVDDAAFDFAASIANPSLNNFIKFITFFASRQFLTPAALLLVAYFVFIRKHRWYSLKVPVVALGSITLNVVLKYFFDRPRPIVPMVEAHGLSFPSGHTMVAASFYGLLIYLVWHNVKPPVLRYTLIAFLSVFVIFIGFSRVYLRVHYATDVLAGFAAGFMWVVIGIWILRRIERYSRKEITPVLMDDPMVKK
ncbi:phosphatase PAP2 family protein [Pontibacter sp. KCTC 32443]|uniref:phosphatase PAP2 family protein n=1 Tax=Pontibacter TaxID=323449 RepID=UPI00164E6A06|nr:MULTISPECIES: phosphatase PAP2 family protein [Pontibacter]MBC5773814.1 phosphatase PAP2 family protein [Pontibacter sp. KCTC 32443]